MAHHEFTPTHYHNTIGWHDPVLAIAPGDTVSTTTVDARGQDQHGERVAERGNPMTGPFYIEGAEPGDTLVVHFDKLYPNRDWGWTAREIAPNVLNPGFRTGIESDGQPLRWPIDLAAGTTTQPDTLPGVVLPLDPMVGCFGVAPPRGQAISTATSATHGGNMDYRGFVTGVTVYLPVEAPGALFHLGDGHAIQGDGEIVGTGVEISFDTTFSVDVIKGKQIGWPRAENDTHILAVGNARPLDQCVQHATTELINWLTEDYGLTELSAHALLGQCVEYDMGNVYDPAYTMVCKVAKSLLSAIGAERS
ncbi:MAG: acetamidase [Gemmatimonadetes bacterium]|nr:acetamidase [Gemmatimonadota bacterium]MYC69316.1 acetamidase [Gemmatimonadota bacterium]MYI62460.1 acetamidase [Gemmatimonadota bacterium]